MAQQFTRVQPGDLITANQMNRILEALESLDGRVTALEAGGGTDGSVVITGFEGPSPLRVGDRLIVNGRNFSVPTILNQITVGGVSVQNATGTSEQLIFDIPDVPGVTEQGTPVAVVVTNSRGSASGQIILRSVLVRPVGRVEVAYTNPPVMPIGEQNITAGRSYIVTYTITAFVTLEASYTVTPTVTGASGWTAVLLQDTSDQPRPNNFITIAGNTAGASRTMRVRVTIPAGQITGTIGALGLAITENTPDSGVTPGNIQIQFNVGSPPPTPETRVRISLRLANPPAVISGNQVQFTRNAGQGNVSFTLHFTEGGTYTVTAVMRNQTGWTSGGIDTPTFTVTPPAPGTTTNQIINVQFAAGATAANTELLLTVRRSTDINVQYALGVVVVLA